MERFDYNFTNAITSKLSAVLGRSLSTAELKAFSLPRSGIAYEMIMDFISDERKSMDEIQHYVEGVVAEL